MQTGKMPKYPIYLISTEFWQHLSRFIHQVKQQNLIDVQKYFRIFDDIEEVFQDIIQQ
jgi:predicted Rossmann-fold nucleotide-binding protein